MVGALGERMPREERREVRLRCDRADARATAAVRDAERLVQVQVADVAAEVAEPRETEKGVQVRAVDVDLSAGVMHRLGDGGDLVLVHAVGRRVGHHECGERIRIRVDLHSEVVEVDVAEIVARYDDDGHPREHRRCSVRAVCALRDQADRSLEVATRTVVAADRQQPRELALAARVRLQ